MLQRSAGDDGDDWLLMLCLCCGDLLLLLTKMMTMMMMAKLIDTVSMLQRSAGGGAAAGPVTTQQVSIPADVSRISLASVIITFIHVIILYIYIHELLTDFRVLMFASSLSWRQHVSSFKYLQLNTRHWCVCCA